MQYFHLMNNKNNLHATTILCIRRNNEVVMIGDGQVSLGSTIMKGTAIKIKELINKKIIVGFAGSTADAFTLFNRLQEKLNKYQNNLAHLRDQRKRAHEKILPVDKCVEELQNALRKFEVSRKLFACYGIKIAPSKLKELNRLKNKYWSFITQ